MQINDPTFPIGAFSHSYGLETYIVKELVTDDETTLDYIIKNLQENFLYSELLAVSLAYDYAMNDDVDKLIELDKLIKAVKAPREIREASEKLGNRLLKTVSNLGLPLEGSIFERYIDSSEKLESQVNYTVVNGVVCAAFKIDKEEVLRAFLYNNTSGLITNAVKAVPLSQTSGQQMMVKLYPVFNTILEQVMDLTIDDLGLNNPGFEIRSMQHETIYTRIYIS